MFGWADKKREKRNWTAQTHTHQCIDYLFYFYSFLWFGAHFYTTVELVVDCMRFFALNDHNFQMETKSFWIKIELQSTHTVERKKNKSSRWNENSIMHLFYFYGIVVAVATAAAACFWCSVLIVYSFLFLLLFFLNFCSNSTVLCEKSFWCSFAD